MGRAERREEKRGKEGRGGETVRRGGRGEERMWREEEGREENVISEQIIAQEGRGGQRSGEPGEEKGRAQRVACRLHQTNRRRR
eukprot:768388-Hanusia_phi.AAC.2